MMIPIMVVGSLVIVMMIFICIAKCNGVQLGTVCKKVWCCKCNMTLKEIEAETRK
jgi:hypothetical protein